MGGVEYLVHSGGGHDFVLVVLSLIVVSDV